MSVRYRMFYRLGYTPWDQDHVPAELSALVEDSSALAPGRALDIGCGTGTQAVYVAQQGWQVTGVDIVERALDHTRYRAERAGVTVRWVAGDATRLVDLGLGDEFGLIHDRGCFHDLSHQDRDAYATGARQWQRPVRCCR